MRVNITKWRWGPLALWALWESRTSVGTTSIKFGHNPLCLLSLLAMDRNI